MNIIFATSTGTIDSVYHTLIRHLNLSMNIVLVSWDENFTFNNELKKIKDYVLMCYCEYGYDWDLEKSGSHIWGKNSAKFPRYYTGDWVKFDNWVKENPPKVTFKRELLAKDVSHEIKPVDYPATVNPYPIQTKEEFLNRPITGSYYFGRSHEGRLILHGNIWVGATKYGYSVCDNLNYFNHFMHHEQGKKYVSFNIPHYVRQPIETIMTINGLSKIGIVPFGAGIKTFRAAEVCCNAVMLMWEDDLAWSFDWVHGVNCLKCKQGEEVETIENWASDERLYSIYVEGVKNWENYRTENYINNYLLPIINKK